MAQRVVIQLVDDIDGTEIEQGKGETIVFALDGTTHEIDLSDSNAKQLRSILEPYVAKGRKVTGTPAPQRRRNTGGSGRSKEELEAIRAWARDNGYEVADRGRIRSEVQDAYDQARS